MAVGGALRAAMKAGDFVKVASESRRRARALAELNASGGIGAPGRARSADEFLRRRGVDVDGMTSPETGNPYMDFVRGPSRYMPDYTESPFGGVVQQGLAGGRNRFAGDAFDYNFPRGIDDRNPRQAYRGPIQAPYEGFRTFPQSGYNEPSSFMGRGRAPRFRDVAEPRNYGDGDDFFAEPFVFDPFGNNSFMNVPRAFGGNPGMGPAPRKRSPRPTSLRSFFFDDFSY